MQFRITIDDASPDLHTIDEALRDIDPAGLVDFDAANRVIRVSTTLDTADLASAMHRAGMPVTLDRIERLPSECCGGCGG